MPAASALPFNTRAPRTLHAMRHDVNFWFGLNGAPPGERPYVYALEKRINPLMVGIALLAIPSFYLEDLQPDGALKPFGLEIDLFILGAFLVETLIMLVLCRQKWSYLKYNWLNVLIIVASALPLVGLNSEWIPLIRLLRITYIGLVFARLLSYVRRIVTANAIPYAFMLGLGAVLLAGLGFYWVEPTIHSYETGLWLAFTTAATVGYGDYVPTTAASRVLAVLVVIVGYAVFSLITASIAAFFIGENEKKLQHEIYRDMKSLRQELHELRDEIVQLTSRAQSQDGSSMTRHSTMPADPEPAEPAGSPQDRSTTP